MKRRSSNIREVGSVPWSRAGVLCYIRPARRNWRSNWRDRETRRCRRRGRWWWSVWRRFSPRSWGTVREDSPWDQNRRVCVPPAASWREVPRHFLLLRRRRRRNSPPSTPQPAIPRFQKNSPGNWSSKRRCWKESGANYRLGCIRWSENGSSNDGGSGRRVHIFQWSAAHPTPRECTIRDCRFLIPMIEKKMTKLFLVKFHLFQFSLFCSFFNAFNVSSLLSTE